MAPCCLYLKFSIFLELVCVFLLQTVSALHYLKENHGVIHRGMLLHSSSKSLIIIITFCPIPDALCQKRLLDVMPSIRAAVTAECPLL